MRKEAESHADEDKQKVELIDARNQADQMIYQIEKLLKEQRRQAVATRTRRRSSRPSRR